MDYAGIGYTYLFGGIGIFVAIFFYIITFLEKILLIQPNKWLKIVQGALIVLLLIALSIIGWFLYSEGLILIDYGKQLDQTNQNISINMSCIDEKKCSANIPNNLLISCLPTTCPQQMSESPQNFTTVNFIYLARPPFSSGVVGLKQFVNEYYLTGQHIESLNLTTVYVQDTYVHRLQYKKSSNLI